MGCDVSQEADRVRLAEAAVTATGRIDVLVNNAAASGETRAEDESPETFSDVLGVNLTGPFHLARLAAEAPGERKSVVNVASILGLVTAAPSAGRATRRRRPG